MHEYIFVVRNMAWWWPHEWSKYVAKIANREQEIIKIQIVVLKGPLFRCFFKFKLNVMLKIKVKMQYSSIFIVPGNKDEPFRVYGVYIEAGFVTAA